ncbi:MAG: TetR/AcrR family transcriptional regulator, partial [Proteobacteria bacterium]
MSYSYSEKEVAIIEAAQKLFLRHGLKKVSMSDIAEASSLSRPSLYASFANKEAVIDGLMKLHTEMNHEITRTRLDSKKSVQEQMETICDVWIIEPYASAIDKEHGKEVMETIEDFAGESTRKMYAEFESYLVEALKPHLKKKNGLTAKDVAAIIVSATKGLKVSTETLPDL